AAAWETRSASTSKGDGNTSTMKRPTTANRCDAKRESLHPQKFEPITLRCVLPTHCTGFHWFENPRNQKPPKGRKSWQSRKRANVTVKVPKGYESPSSRRKT